MTRPATKPPTPTPRRPFRACLRRCDLGFNAYTGILVIVDDPATIGALNTGGPAANAYLNEALVGKLANQIH
ncbi:MAG: eukaryotic-like serine/threonine-protein kinase [Mycobacterium sp.]|nr:eukaryotic-like serine/threonine-protein kinase [Mycobacterium sp.]